MPPILVEACVETLAAALAAAEGGAGRVELCASLEVGGLTPPDELIRESVRRLAIPVFVLVRPRPGSFVLRGTELTHLADQVRRAAGLGAAGIVAGALTDDGAVDRVAVEAILAAAGPLPVTFHRAFDQVRGPGVRAGGVDRAGDQAGPDFRGRPDGGGRCGTHRGAGGSGGGPDRDSRGRVGSCA